MSIAFRQVRASYTENTITVYQAYSAAIAEEALRLGRFGPMFSRSRMTWIKPSFLWMMYRCAPVRVHWDPERDLHTRPLTHRSVQIGLSGPAVAHYVDDWITAITEVAHTIATLIAANRSAEANGLLPAERPYPLPADVMALTGTTPDPARTTPDEVARTPLS